MELFVFGIKVNEQWLTFTVSPLDTNSSFSRKPIAASLMVSRFLKIGEVIVLNAIFFLEIDEDDYETVPITPL